jgi:protein-disulfide reductase (glutathione)
MRQTIALALAITLAAFGWARAATPEGADLFNGVEIDWRDARTGIYEAAKTHTPAIVVFHATWCSVCKRYRSVFKDPRIVAAAHDFVMILIDADRERSLNGAFSPDGTYVPRTLFIDPDGNISDALVGKDPQYPHTIDADSPEELLSLMRKAKETGFGGLKPDTDAPALSVEQRT